MNIFIVGFVTLDVHKHNYPVVCYKVTRKWLFAANECLTGESYFTLKCGAVEE